MCCVVMRCQGQLGDSPSPSLQMLSFSMDPQWCGMLFSLYGRHEYGPLLSASSFPQSDALSTYSLGPPLDVDWIALAGSVGFELCQLSSTWALIFQSVKATGVILLLGVGSFVCYKIYNYCWPRNRPGPGNPPGSHRNGALIVVDGEEVIEELDEDELESIEGRYFGPSPSPDVHAAEAALKGKIQSITSAIHHDSGSPSQSDGGTSGEDADASDGSQGEKLSPLQNMLRRQKLVWSESPLHSRHHSPRNWRRSRHLSSSTASLDLKPRSTRHSVDNSGWLVRKISNLLAPTPELQQSPGSGSLSLPVTPGHQRKRNVCQLDLKRRHVLGWAEEGLVGHKGPYGGHVRSHTSATATPPSYSDPLSSTSPVTCHIVRDESYDSLGFSKRLAREGSFDSTCSELSFDFCLPESSANTSTMVNLEKLQSEIDQLKSNCQMMDEEFETIKCNRNLPGMSSLMKASTTHANLPADAQFVPVDVEGSENLKQQNARACFAGLYSLTTIKNSTSSELSDSFPMSVQGRGSIGSTESLDWDSPKPARSPVKLPLGNLDEDFVTEAPVYSAQQCPVEEHVSFTIRDKSSVASTPLHQRQMITNSSPLNKKRFRSQTSDLTLAPSEDELMENLEWDEDDLMEYPEDGVEASAVSGSVNMLDMDLEVELTSKSRTGSIIHQTEEAESAVQSMTSSRSCTTSPATERLSRVESGFESKMMDSFISQSSQMGSDWNPSGKPWTCWSSEESGYMEWDGTLDRSGTLKAYAQQSWDEPTAMSQNSQSEQSSPASEMPSSEPWSPTSELSTPTSKDMPESVGPKQDILQYAVREWHGGTKKAETVLKGYAEIPSLLGLHNLRKIRGDNYCGVRATIFQVLAAGLPVPNGAASFEWLSEALNSGGCAWLQEWKFADCLPYRGNTVLHGMEECLHSLDNVVSLLSSKEDRSEMVAQLFNRDPFLDLHIMEAVKLHMLKRAMELHQANISGSEVPLFAILMFARDTSETPRDFMNNHLREVGNSGGLEQVEMYLLGYTLEVTLRVVRPAAYGSSDFICSYPDWNEGRWPEVVLIAEDDRHYNVLVC